MVAVFLRVLGVYFGLKFLSRLSDYDLTRNQDTVPSPNLFFIYPPIKLYTSGKFLQLSFAKFLSGDCKNQEGLRVMS